MSRLLDSLLRAIIGWRMKKALRRGETTELPSGRFTDRGVSYTFIITITRDN